MKIFLSSEAVHYTQILKKVFQNISASAHKTFRNVETHGNLSFNISEPTSYVLQARANEGTSVARDHLAESKKIGSLEERGVIIILNFQGILCI